MFQTPTTAPRRVVTGFLKPLLATFIAAASLAGMATPVRAAAIYLDEGERFTPAQVTIAGPASAHYNTVTDWAGPVLFTANFGSAASANTFTFLGFSVDIFDEIDINVNSPTMLDLAYHDGPLVDNGEHGAAQAAAFMLLSTTQKNQINALVNFGTSLWDADSVTDPTHQNMSNTLIDQLGGIQGAIWQIENPTFTFLGSTSPYGGAGNEAAVTNYINIYTSVPFLNTLSRGQINVVFNDSASPAFAFVPSAPVPEPKIWQTMIVGFGSVGLVLRRRRRNVIFRLTAIRGVRSGIA